MEPVLTSLTNLSVGKKLIGGFGLVLLLTTFFQVRCGLAPLKRISESLAAIRSGA